MTKRQALIDIDDFHSRVAGGVKPRSAVSVQFRFAPETIGADLENRVVPFIFSDNSVDAYGDTIDAKGWIFDRSGAGTVALFGHDSSKVENIIGRAHNVRVEGNKLLGDIQFASAEENPNAERVFRLVKGGFVNSVSVGFQPLEWTLAKDKSRPGGIDFRKQKLLEISVVGIPANENAIAQARAFGLDVEGLQFEAAPKIPTLKEINEFLRGRATIQRAEPSYLKRGLYSVSALAGILAELGWLEEGVEWEAEYEGDGSEIPQRLTDAMKLLGQILIDMTVEEVSELLADDEDVDGMVDLIILETPTPAQKAFAALVKLSGLVGAVMMPRVEPLPTTLTILERAGKVLSSANETKIRDVHAAMTGACDTLQTMLDALEPDDITEKTAAELAAAAERAARLREVDILAVSGH